MSRTAIDYKGTQLAGREWFLIG